MTHIKARSQAIGTPCGDSAPCYFLIKHGVMSASPSLYSKQETTPRLNLPGYVSPDLYSQLGASDPGCLNSFMQLLVWEVPTILVNSCIDFSGDTFGGHWTHLLLCCKNFPRLVKKMVIKRGKQYKIPCCCQGFFTPYNFL